MWKVMLAVMALSIGPSTVARAQSCASGTPFMFQPQNGAVEVPSDAVLYARYDQNVRYAGEPVLFAVQGEPAVELVANFDRAESALRVVPPAPLASATFYEVIWPALGLVPGVRGEPGRARTVRFSTGRGPDREAPAFGGLQGIDWSWENKRDACTGDYEDRYVFSLSPGPVRDDSGRDSLSLLVFETEGPQTTGEPRLVSIAPFPRDEQPIKVPRAVAAGHGRLCFTAIVRDATQKVSSGAAEPLCVTTVALPYFNGCAMATGVRQGDAVWPAILMISTVLAGLKRVRRSRAHDGA